MMKARIQWAGETILPGESGNGHVVVMNGPPDHGGRNLGACSMEMVLVGPGGCTNFDVVSILKKARQPVESYEAFLEAERTDKGPRVFTKIRVHFAVRGHDLREAQVKRTMELSTEKYCSTSIVLGHGKVETTRDHGIVELD